MAKKETQEVAVQERALTPEQITSLDNLGSWGAEETSAADLIIPKILIMQGLSKFVMDEKIQARQGEIRDSLEGKLLAKIGETIKFIPFFFYNTWVDYVEKEGKFVFVAVYDRNHANENLEREWVENGVRRKRMKSVNCYVLLQKELSGGVYLPYLLSFSSTAYKTGKKLITLVEKLKQFKISPAERVFTLSVGKMTNEKGTWFTPDVSQEEGVTSKEDLFKAYQWYLKVAKGGVQVDNSDLVNESSVSPEVVSNEY